MFFLYLLGRSRSEWAGHGTASGLSMTSVKTNITISLSRGKLGDQDSHDLSFRI